jgi:DNA-nicking Smr family endonuclease
VKKKKDILIEEEKVWQEYIKDPRDLFDKEIENKSTLAQAKRYRFDLHGFTLLEANKKVEQLIIYCQKNNFKEILLITGKGLHSNTDQNAYVSKELSKLKFAVPEFIKTQKDLLDKISSIAPAQINDGGEGAIIIKLKKL